MYNCYSITNHLRTSSNTEYRLFCFCSEFFEDSTQWFVGVFSFIPCYEQMFGALAGNVYLSCQQFDVVLRIYFFAAVY